MKVYEILWKLCKVVWHSSKEIYYVCCYFYNKPQSFESSGYYVCNIIVFLWVDEVHFNLLLLQLHMHDNFIHLGLFVVIVISNP